MRKTLCVAILGAFVVALVAETALFVTGHIGGLSAAIELAVAWAVVLVGFCAAVVRAAWGVGRPIVGVWVFHKDEPEDEQEDSEDEQEDSEE